MASMFKPASRKKVKLRAAFPGPAGSGKTFTALRLAFALGKRVAVINTESGAVEKYMGLEPDGIPWEFDVCELENFSPSTYTTAILEAGRLGYGVLIIDSLSHAWSGEGGALSLVDQKAAKSRSGNTYTAWKDVTPMHDKMISSILQSPCHVIATMRSKMEIVPEERNGKMVPVKLGMAPIQRQGTEYEFDLVGDLDLTHTLTISKSRCPAMDGVVVVKPGADCFAPLVRWLTDGIEVPADYYAATEADLKRSKAAQAAASVEVGKPEPPSLLDKARAAEKAEKAANREKLPTDPATKAQLDELLGLLKQLSNGRERAANLSTHFGVERLGKLTYAQAIVAKTMLLTEVATRDYEKTESGNGHTNGNGSVAIVDTVKATPAKKGEQQPEETPFG